MCPHEHFDIIYYLDGIMVRRCKECSQTEVQTEYWIDIDTLRGVFSHLEQKYLTDKDDE